MSDTIYNANNSYTVSYGDYFKFENVLKRILKNQGLYFWDDFILVDSDDEKDPDTTSKALDQFADTHVYEYDGGLLDTPTLQSDNPKTFPQIWYSMLSIEETLHDAKLIFYKVDILNDDSKYNLGIDKNDTYSKTYERWVNLDSYPKYLAEDTIYAKFANLGATPNGDSSSPVKGENYSYNTHSVYIRYKESFMAKLVWDAIGEHFFENGNDHGVLYRVENKAYSKGVAWNGLTAVTESPEGGDANDMWADNLKYASVRGAVNWAGTIEAYTSPEEFDECDGTVAATKGVYVGQQARKPFGFCYRSNVGNDLDPEVGYKLHLIYGLTASPSSRNYQTINENPEGMTFSWEVKSIPVATSKYGSISTIEIDSTKCDAVKLAALEKVLYGDGATEARLPLPDEVFTIVGATA